MPAPSDDIKLAIVIALLMTLWFSTTAFPPPVIPLSIYRSRRRSSGRLRVHMGAPLPQHLPSGEGRSPSPTGSL
jgi:hypothetical protein